jgi:hypothetical protein
MMKRKDLVPMVGVILITAIIAFVFSNIVFKVPQDRATKVPAAGSIDNNFPDIKNDSTYNTIFNNNAYDPAVPLNASSTPNNQPFHGSQ